MTTNIQTLAACIETLARFDKGTALPHATDEWRERVRYEWRTLLEAIMRDAPSGSGIDCGTTLCEQVCSDKRIEMYCEFHHMDANGYYDGWTRHSITITPAFDGIDVRVGGRDRNGIKEYLAETYYEWARSECPHQFTLPTRGASA